MGQFSDLGKKYGEKKPPVDDVQLSNKHETNNNVTSTNENICNDEQNVAGYLTALDGLSNETLSSLSNDLRLINNECFKNYLRNLDTLPIVPFAEKTMLMSWIRIDKIVYEKDVFFTENLSIIYTALHETAESIAIVLHKESGGLLQLYLGVRDMPHLKNYISKYVLQRGINGCLPGISFYEESPTLKDNGNMYVSSVSGIASLKGEKKAKFTQGIERLINSTHEIPAFTVVMIAENVNIQSNKTEQTKFEQIYSRLFQYSEKSITASENFSSSDTMTETEGSSKTEGKTYSKTESDSTTRNESTQKTESDSGGVNFPLVNKGTSKSESTTNGATTTNGTSTANGTSGTTGTNASTATAKGETKGGGTSEQVKYEDKTIKELLKRLEKLLDRMKFAENFGLWNVSSYFITDTNTSSLGLASIYKGIISGSETVAETSSVNVWNTEKSKEILRYLKYYKHPKFNFDDLIVTPCSTVNSEELAICLSLPQTSIPGVLVKEQPVFGRNVIFTNGKPQNLIGIGNLVHLGKENDKNQVELCEDWLTSHLFVTGTTGSGKSNTVYLLLSKLKEKDKKFLVVESAKGEYKNVFGGLDDVTVLGTNPNLMQQLKINPFAFPDNIHVEEHIDRLIDIFNACWAMYAAMPAVLKEAITKAYKSCGWDLLKSQSKYGIYPTFDDVIRELNAYINNSEYSSDSKGDYKGAIGTRLQSLTNGIIGQIFSGTPIDDDFLFNQNVIIDLSRVGSTETKALIMGMLVMKLNEFRMSENIGMNLSLRHVTVLEEAHNLLKRTSTVQSQESANLTGKSVEMIATAIAEMRTYGEGFIIADQSPSMLDAAAISNTNTKIVMALPDKNDREIAGNAIALNEQQINEISRLKTGIAVVYQKGWEESVLCHISRYDDVAEYKPELHLQKAQENVFKEVSLANILYDGYVHGKDIRKSDLEFVIKKSALSGKQKKEILEILAKSEMIMPDVCAQIFVPIIGADLFLQASKCNSIKDFNNMVIKSIENLESFNSVDTNTFVNMYMKGCSIMNKVAFYDTWFAQTYYYSQEKQ
jgi:hypothetical protein